MARQVAQALAEGSVALVEAGTGTGKSLAYLLPLARHLLERGGDARAVVATYTINLQEQLVARELPVVERALGRPVRTAVAKGWGNYLCLLRLHRLQQGRALWLEGPGPEALPASDVEALAQWAQTSREGSLSELPPDVGLGLWSLVAADPDRCTRRRCPFYEGCFYFQARQRVLQAQIVVANHHLLLADLVVRREAGGADAAVLPPFQYLVVDEAHHLDEAATAHLGMEVSRAALLTRLQRLARGRGARGLDQAAAEALACVQALFDRLAQAVVQRDLQGADAEVPRTVRLEPGDGERLVTGPVLDQAVDALDRLAGAAHRMAQTLEAASPDPEHDDQREERVVELRAVARWAQQTGQRLLTLLQAADDDYVFWVEVGPRQELALKAAPLEVGTVLAGELLGGVRAAILTSATLACGGRFDALRRRLGLPVPADAPRAGPGVLWPDDADVEAEQDEDGVLRVVVGGAGQPHVVRSDGRVVECVIPSPFDFRRQAVVAVPADFPDVDAPAFPGRLADLVEGLASQLAGRTFVLFTSYRALSETRQILEGRLEGKGIGLLCQGDRPRSWLLDAFRQAGGEGWVLLGTDSFWEGVDVPGAALSCVVLARLPFAVPDHPIALARAERLRRQGLNPFREEALPRAVLKFRQGFGRLVRTQQDRGAVVVADRRLLTRSYRASFLDALPRCQLVVAPAERIVREVASWIAPPLPSPSP